MRWMTRGQPAKVSIIERESTNDATAERLDRLERANKRLTAALGLLGLVALIAVAVGATGQDARSLDAERITLRDEAGRVRAELVADKQGPSLTLFDAEAKERLRLHAADDGTTTLSLATPARGEVPSRSIAFRTALDGWSTLAFTDSAKQERLALGLGYDGEPRLRMYTKDGRARVSLGSDMSGRVDCILHDASGSERAVIRSGPGGAATFTVYDGEGKALFRAP